MSVLNAKRAHSGYNLRIVEWDNIPKDTEILLTHTPPFGNLDLTRRGKNAGCKQLASRLEVLDQCRLHIFGHIHEGYGSNVRKRKVGNNELDFVSVNAALPDGGLPIIVDLKN